MISSRTLTLAVATVALFSVAVPAGSQPSPGPADPAAAYGASSAGGRGFGRPMTLAEYQGRQRARIMSADADHDGRVSLSEWIAYQAQRREGSNGEGGANRSGGGFGGDPTRQFERMDANHDGYVTPAEIDAASAERFARMDANHDGVVTPDERRAMRGGGDAGQPPPQ